jgi:hypothetical protein
MTDEALLRLALQAVHDRTAQPVLGDAVLEAGWYDERVMCAVIGDRYSTSWQKTTPQRLRNLFFKRAAKPDRRWCRYVAGFMWLGHWSGPEGWPLIEHLYPRPTAAEILRQMWSDIGIMESVYEESPFLRMLPREYSGTFVGVNREADPARLAGFRIDGNLVQPAKPGDVPTHLSPREAIIEAARRCQEQSEKIQLPRNRNVLTDIWQNEIDGQLRQFSRGVMSHYVPPRRRRYG